MLKNLRSVLQRNHGQNMIEYTLVFVAIVLVLFVALGPQGAFRKAISNSLDGSVNMIDSITNSINIEDYKGNKEKD